MHYVSLYLDNICRLYQREHKELHLQNVSYRDFGGEGKT